MFSVYAGANGEAHIYVYHWSDVDTRDAARTATLQHLWNMGYNAGAYLNNGAPNMYNALSTFRINIIVSHAAPGVIRLGKEDDISWLYANSAVSGKNRSISNLQANSLSDMRLFLYAGCETGLNASNGGNLVTMTRAKGAKCVVGWNCKILGSVVADWIYYLFEKADVEQDVLWECFNHGDYWVGDKWGAAQKSVMKNRHEAGNINQYLYDLPD